MINTSKGFLETYIGEASQPVLEENLEKDLEKDLEEGLNLDSDLDNLEDCDLEESVDAFISEDCGDITIGEWAFLTEGDFDDARAQLLEDVLDEIDAEVIDLNESFEEFEFEDGDDDLLYEAMGTTIRRIAKIAKKKPFTAAKVAGKRAAHVAGKAGRAVYNRLKNAASVASKKAREWAVKAKDLAAKGMKAASDRARLMASKLSKKAKDLMNKAKEAWKKFRMTKAQKAKVASKARKTTAARKTPLSKRAAAVRKARLAT